MNGEKDDITYNPAECWSRCEDKHCPYIHTVSWEFHGVNYQSRLEAAHARAAYMASQHSTKAPAR